MRVHLRILNVLICHFVYLQHFSIFSEDSQVSYTSCLPFIRHSLQQKQIKELCQILVFLLTLSRWCSVKNVRSLLVTNIHPHEKLSVGFIDFIDKYESHLIFCVGQVLDVPTGTEEEDDVSVQLYTFNNNNKSEADELDKFSTHRQSSDNC